MKLWEDKDKMNKLGIIINRIYSYVLHGERALKHVGEFFVVCSGCKEVVCYYIHCETLDRDAKGTVVSDCPLCRGRIKGSLRVPMKYENKRLYQLEGIVSYLEDRQKPTHEVLLDRNIEIIK